MLFRSGSWVLRLLAELAGGYLACGFFAAAHAGMVLGREVSEYDVFVRGWRQVLKTFALTLPVFLVIGVLVLNVSPLALLFGSAGPWLRRAFNALCLAQFTCFLACLQETDFLSAILQGARLMARARGVTLAVFAVYLAGMFVLNAAVNPEYGVLWRTLLVVAWHAAWFGCGLAYLSFRRRSF